MFVINRGLWNNNVEWHMTPSRKDGRSSLSPDDRVDRYIKEKERVYDCGGKPFFDKIKPLMLFCDHKDYPWRTKEPGTLLNAAEWTSFVEKCQLNEDEAMTYLLPNLAFCTEAN